MSTLATRYKSEADKYFSDGRWSKALNKYRQAAKYAPEDSDIFVDIAACSLELQLYDDVITNARRAIELNSLNASAWGYLAAAYRKLEQWITCFEAYDNALSILKHQDPPNDRLKDTLQLSYTEAKKQAKLRKADGVKHLFSGLNPGEQPWERAAIVKEEFESTHPKSGPGVTSAWVILEAHKEFKEGYSLLKEIKRVPLPSGSLGLSGNAQAIAYLTNGIVRDERCFYMEDQVMFMKLLGAQAEFEVIRTAAWDLTASESTVMAEASTRQAQKGWDDVRPALSTTVRIWILNAHISQGLGQYGQAVGLYRRALAVLDWGRGSGTGKRGEEGWSVGAKASRKERGAIFDSTFVRGVRLLYGKTLVRAYEQTKGDKNQPYTLRDIIQVSERTTADCRDRPVKTVLASGKPASKVFILSYQKYPEGNARMGKGYYYFETGRAKLIDGKDRPDALRDLRLSANEYQNACLSFPRDDEYYSICLLNALDALFLTKTITLKESSMILTDLRDAWASGRKIWSHSSFANGGGAQRIERMLKFQENALRAVQDGKCAMGDRIGPGRLGDRIL